MPAAQITRVFPTAACFIVPGETDWRGFMRRRPEARLRWPDQKTLERAAIFLPLDTTPQDVRDCLHEEITQALGPADDLYRLPDSIWNDDNFHGMATPFDMTILRALYQPEFRSGMTREEAAAVAARGAEPGEPQGPRAAAAAAEPGVAGLGRGDRGGAVARRAAQQAAGGGDHRRADRGGDAAGRPPARGLAADARAARNSGATRPRRRATSPRRTTFSAASSASDDVRTAQAGVHLAALALGTGQYQVAITLADRHLPAARDGQNAILIAGLLSIKAEALAGLGQAEEAQATRLDSLRWARYGFGDTDGALAREQAQLAALMRLENG